ncbi:BCCT family transporter [Helicobacter aurati]|uniref:BCCT family transporter n=1 Tax=Helicobacter aurati TaxID=137778 RepID=A0A3D8J4J1_9HELI|nr:BCCT family transporter [Helicobacter aurati]RDU72388.1 BCCT family transporter [Helicobacter aurati]
MNPKQNHEYTLNTTIDKSLVSISVVCVVIIAMCIYLFPETTNRWASVVFDWVTSMLGSSIQLLILLGLILCLYIAISKYGNIKMGNQEPEYKTLPWLFMFICAGIGSSIFYWATIEWVYYYQSPGLGIEPNSTKALEATVAYSFFHWGIGAWSTYALASIAMAYHFHVRKNKGLSLSGMVAAIFKIDSRGIVGKIIDMVFLMSSVGALTLSLVLSVIILSIGVSTLTDIPDNFITRAIITIISATMFCLSTYIGIDKGMQSLSAVVGYGSLLLAAIVLVIGPTEFILNNITNSVGFTFSHYFQMSLFTDPFGKGEFTKSWTIYYWLWWISYTPAVALFVARVSAGRKIREIIWAFLLGSTTGTWFLFGVLESYSIHEFLTGTLNVVDIVNQKGGEAGLVATFLNLPLGKMFLAILLFLMVIMLASHMDAVAYAMAATSTRNLAEGQDPGRSMKLFWCAVLTLIPLAILYINAPLSTLKTSVVLSGLPFLVILLIILFGFIRWLLRDYGRVPPHVIETHAVHTEQNTCK